VELNQGCQAPVMPRSAQGTHAAPGREGPDEGRNITVTPKAVEWLPRIRDHLIEVAEAGGTITYGDLKADLGLRIPPTALGACST
jgi:hypothetical protein